MWIVFFALWCYFLLILPVIPLWIIFTKAGEKGWKSLIPIYNIVIFFKIIKISPFWVLGTLLIIPQIDMYRGMIKTLDNFYFWVKNNSPEFILVIINLFTVGLSSYVIYKLAIAFGKNKKITNLIAWANEIFWSLKIINILKYNTFFYIAGAYIIVMVDIIFLWNIIIVSKKSQYQFSNKVEEKE